jgi:hypothetical protein
LLGRLSLYPAASYGGPAMGRRSYVQAAMDKLD